MSASWEATLASFASAFTAPSFRIFVFRTLKFPEMSNQNSLE